MEKEEMSQIRRTKNKPSLDRLTTILLAAFILVGSITAVVAFTFVRNMVTSWKFTSLPGVTVPDANNGSPAANSNTSAGTEVPSTIALQPMAGPTPQAWDGASRVTVLVMGLDYRDWEAGETPRTDSMMLFTLDPLSKTAGILSIPRDLWINIPNFGYGKINTAYYLGEVNKLPGGGPGLAMKTVEEFLGVPINYYAQIDFQAFVSFIDHIDGVKIDIPAEITVDPIGQWNTVTLPPGRITLDGKTALAYARARYTEGGDFDRAKRQQQVVLGIRDRILTFNMLPKLITNAPLLYKDLSDGVHTNLSLDQIIQLALLAQQVSTDNIRHAIIGNEQVTFGTSPDGLDILKPIPDKIRIVRDEIFTTGGPLSPAAVATNPDELMRSENARISIQNGTGTGGLAGLTSDYFKTLGLNVAEETNADQIYTTTTLIDYSGKPYTLSYLQNMMKVPQNRIFNRYDPNAQVDIVVILGNDWANSNPMP